jgi:hypothetical protein
MPPTEMGRCGVLKSDFDGGCRAHTEADEDGCQDQNGTISSYHFHGMTLVSRAEL